MNFFSALRLLTIGGLFALLTLGVDSTEASPQDPFQERCIPGDVIGRPRSECIPVNYDVAFPSATPPADAPIPVPDEPPPPGGLGSGVTYKLEVMPNWLTERGIWSQMTIYPSGLGLGTLKPGMYLYTTSANARLQYQTNTGGLEILGAYEGNTAAYLAIFDWSCTVAEPCTAVDGSRKTSAAFVMWTAFTGLTCNYYLGDDGGGHTHNKVQYGNRTYKLANGKWRNIAYLYNRCTGRFDVPYTHDYSVDPHCLSITLNCMWWGPIIETFWDADGARPMKELGYLNSGTTTDFGGSQALTSSDSSFANNTPIWNVYHLGANWKWAIGNYTNYQ